MQLPDLINGGLELFGGVFSWLNTKQLLKDKEVRGVSLAPTAVFSLWGLWNLYYYPSLDQWASFSGGLVIVTSNLIWITLALKYKYKKYA